LVFLFLVYVGGIIKSMDQNKPPLVVFEGEQYQQPVGSFELQTPTILQLVVKYSHGLIRSEKQATYALIVLIIIVIPLVYYMWSSGASVRVREDARLLIETAIKNTNAPQ
jgi:hypothetical protein